MLGWRKNHNKKRSKYVKKEWDDKMEVPIILIERDALSKSSKFTKMCHSHTEKSLQDGHTIKRTLYKADKDFSPNLKFSGQILLKVISIKRTLP